MTQIRTDRSNTRRCLPIVNPVDFDGVKKPVLNPQFISGEFAIIKSPEFEGIKNEAGQKSKTIAIRQMTALTAPAAKQLKGGEG